MRITIGIVLTLSLVTSIAAQENEKVIIPVVAYDVPGAFGSRWNTELWIHNGTDMTIDFEDDVMNVQLGCVGIPCEQPTPLPSGSAKIVNPNIDLLGMSFKAMRMLDVRREIAAQITFSLRVHDSSRALSTWGTEIPVVREADLLTGNTILLGVPVTGPFRQTLRIYAPRKMSSGCETVAVRVFELETGSTLASFDTTLTDSGGATCLDEGSWPASAEIHNLVEMLPEGHPDRVGLEIAPTTAELKYWAMVSITNDDTQHVTMITSGGNTGGQVN